MHVSRPIVKRGDRGPRQSLARTFESSGLPAGLARDLLESIEATPPCLTHAAIPTAALEPNWSNLRFQR
jgi:hypothetical protein